MKSTAKRVLTLVIGWAFILVGIAGLFLPFIQGVLCILIGLIILSGEYVWAHKLLQKLKTRFPKLAHLSEEAKLKAEGWLHRVTRRKPKESRPESRDTASQNGACECVPVSRMHSANAVTPEDRLSSSN
ncbi:MAG TPA: PGPGW domain-containing protein [Terriglobales bacterium]|nr:PGPGW domain-containing protein [Terriglobales bacterium]